MKYGHKEIRKALKQGNRVDVIHKMWNVKNWFGDEVGTRQMGAGCSEVYIYIDCKPVEEATLNVKVSCLAYGELLNARGGENWEERHYQVKDIPVFTRKK